MVGVRSLVRCCGARVHIRIRVWLLLDPACSSTGPRHRSSRAPFVRSSDRSFVQAEPMGAVLVFMPGMMEIMKLYNRLRDSRLFNDRCVRS